ncbi:MAG: Heme A synthase, cytochrome oxidase biogenesis protein Cox15-CtaA [uncultured Acetobacteraceae bacterium]|uniref:Heme A synthase n=1 Tax=uncultured Acetobacteraceae bacterium TaxID=169975 RepID=A0A6J4ID45_9PROT|nr:MAG: Heme A synthase, cytochrome oxidase biogenesis protein Cox15-CtaA [uncultured Acetobacteraceae bacterium]
MPFDAHHSAAATETERRDARAVGRWLLAMAAMVWAMVALGGATRLSGSGLSIMEWAPIMGTLPPLSDAEWQRLYDLYRTIPQYALVNQGFGMEGFQRIFWLEWAHRFWGRAIGLAYAGGLLWFWLRGRIPAGLKPRLLLLLALGGLQGVVGWLMVASGFEADRTAVSPWRLVAHLGLALALYAALLWTALGLLARREEPTPDEPPAVWRGVRRQVKAAVWLLAAAMLAGGFTAGIRAGLDYNTFPLMDGRLVPEGYWRLQPAWLNLTENVAAVQFNHRLLATLAALAAFGAALAAWRRLPDGPARRACLGLGAAVALQYALGVATLLLVVPAWLGTLHQASAVLVLTAALLALRRLPAPWREPGREAARPPMSSLRRGAA